MTKTISSSSDIPDAPVIKRKPFYHHLYVQVLAAILLGILLGHISPGLGEQMKPLGDTFIKMIKMLIAPIIFCTVVSGIASMQNLKKIGRIGFKSLVYFEVLTTLALIVGLIGVNLFKPGVGMHIDPATLDASAIAGYTKAAHDQSVVGFLTHIIPTTVFGAFADGEILQVLFISVLFAFGLQLLGPIGKPLLATIDLVAQAFFRMLKIVMYVAPLGAFGGMAFTVGKYGIGSLAAYGNLLICYYVTGLVFVFVILNLAARLAGFSLWKFLKYIREELFLVLGTSSSESALPRLMTKLEKLGCEKSTVGLVVPSGYCFNLDGSCINMTVLAIFIAQALDIDVSLYHQITLLLILLLTSKGAASVTGGAFITLAATLGSIDVIPAAGLVLVLGVYRFISEGGALINVIGNGVAALFVARWEGVLDQEQLKRELG
ncbi:MULTISPECIES: C4-dicarboxylate transporter DctA [unclassified Pseudomonas]|jgi:Na+/H+-dicarboxylate symporters|uniref:C4-dicarboxylate transporter DctA n=1 Tax=unclassified Pseudomonas TaxID=196821 RepID=UPI00040EBF43|nr:MULTISPECIES: C4-dicarboxylate transporter DctA [unclassified Pseudomonas]GHS81599.1 C4-dicarboxylate transport protein [Pseudomonas sp. PAGU 2196]SMF18864.1 aerobic C4-dicarboxylate transport protein [Pseudomonas sp. LAIL14HWK12:I11]SMR77295.1 aerobic C4-dicarboxylate transport protein [Pseudomonas sp. LAIL14HWK12:I10]SOD02925.1 aerobic C4-dicarboxylate transport protein [Pseudomonas sp. LAIL14HWK12:I8]